ncbi:hypothetical protein ORIO_11200 [Cereibacter azotoformans]|uniref:Uncharacterized protein n=1 Tax=Cereibacter azotoformans TaxID=43057 RepID=A0A2T5KBZ9_9RHOB|nr:hypothetical protein [Cereibacter azotoformans]MBO4167950.1 hypothetical protein [Cereibacter azotoformans]PTR19882.1 hypothetical protein C8J28_1036 [Cereibacter azotoformans]ULB10466.1 hypothetical protein ORIO_11200 [Cereibacter azotoformans]
MSPFVVQALILGTGVGAGLWLVWWRVGQPSGLRRWGMALAAGLFCGAASFVISRAIASV